MRLLSRVGFVTSFAALAVVAACSDSSGPSAGETPAVIAARFDSIYVDAFARSDSGANGYSTRALLATLLEINAAFGSSPTAVTVTTASGTEHWKGYEFVELNNNQLDSEFVLLAYRENAAHSVMIVFFDSTGAGHSGGVITNDTLNVQPSAAHGTTHRLTIGSTCTTPSASLLNPQFSMFLISTCTLATFQTAVSMSFPATTGVDPALASLSFTATTINGERIVDANNSGRRVQQALHALHDKLRAM